MSDHAAFMRLAIKAAKVNPDFPFGAVLVENQSGEVMATGTNRGHENPIWHGEIDAINRFAAKRSRVAWPSLRLYTTAEPCPMCQSAILWAGIPSVVFGTSIVTLKQLGWNQIDIRSREVAERTPFGRCEIMGGILEAECDALFRAANRRKLDE